MFEFNYVDIDMAGPNKLVRRSVIGRVLDQGRHYMIVETTEGETLPIPRSAILGWRLHDDDV